MKTFEVQFQPDGLRIDARSGTILSDAIKALGINVLMPCGGEGTCGKCAVEIHPDPPAPGPLDIKHLTSEEIGRGVRLACQTRVDRAMSVLISPGMRVLGDKILVDGLKRTFDLDPSVIKTYTELPEPTLEDQASDLFRIERALNLPDGCCPDFDIDLLRELYSLIREADFKVTTVTANGRMIGIEPGNTVSRKYGIAFDIGTTTVVGTVLDLITGRELAHASRLNGQVIHGEDTISRIKYVMENPGGREEMAKT
ncbi:MAG: 2Fe-2S iron-sulfur cluster-binding protein, partial [Candidatus Latescibacterota bacterium]